MYDLHDELFRLRPAMLAIKTENRHVNQRGVSAILEGNGIEHVECGPDIVAYDRFADEAYKIRLSDMMISETVMPPEYLDESGHYQELNGAMAEF